MKTNKNDRIERKLSPKVVGRPKMRFVADQVSDEQLDMQSLHRVRERWIMLMHGG